MGLIELKYTIPAYATRIGILVIDTFAVVTCLYFAIILRFNFDWAMSNKAFIDLVPYILIARLICFRLFRTYAVIVRYAGLVDLKQVFGAVLTSSGVFILFSLVTRPLRIESLATIWGYYFPISILLIDMILLVLAMSAFRLLMPYLYRVLFEKKTKRENVIILGAGLLGAQTVNAIRRDAKQKYNVVAILDDNPDLHRKYLDGVPVFNWHSYNSIVDRKNVDTAILAMQNIELDRKSQIVERCLDKDVKVLRVPPTKTWMGKQLDVDRIREVRIDDLLNRPSINLEKGNIRTLLKDKVVLVTGGAGSIGSELVRQIVSFEPKELIVLDIAESPLSDVILEIQDKGVQCKVTGQIGDVADKHFIESIFQKFRPQVVYHAAAYKHVPLMELFPREALKVNVLGTRQVIDASIAFKVTDFVLVSSDKAVNPTNVMGASKRIAEQYVQYVSKTSRTKFVTTRFGNVLGSNGSVVPRFKKQILEGGPVTVTHPEINRYFMTIPEASQLVLEASAMGKGKEIFLFDMGTPIKILDLAEKLIKLAGLKPHQDIKIDFTGLRPGEKLKEDLLSSSENSIPTHHPKITIAKYVKEPDADFLTKFDELISSLNCGDDFVLVKLMKQLVPEYISNNSRFDRIDESKVIQLPIKKSV